MARLQKECEEKAVWKEHEEKAAQEEHEQKAWEQATQIECLKKAEHDRKVQYKAALAEQEKKTQE